MKDPNELEQLRAENTQLKSLLDAHGIAWQLPALPPTTQSPAPLSSRQKVTLFNSLFRGRTDVVPVRWENQAGKAGYTPACGNEWRPGVCEKPRIKCSDCQHRDLLPLTDRMLVEHFTGRRTIGVYPLLADDRCHFVAVDFDDADWREDVKAFARSCRELGVPVALEISRSGEGAHAWIFFAGAVPAREARRLATALISRTCAQRRQLELGSYDRLFPSQDTLPTRKVGPSGTQAGGFGNLIALPLQKKPRDQGRSVFVDAETLRPFGDQWAYLAGIERMAWQDIEPVITRATGGSHPLDIAYLPDDEAVEPWKPTAAKGQHLQGPMPELLSLTLANLIYIEKAGLPQPLANRLVRLAAFQNPEFHRAQAMRMPVWDKPRVIGCAENFPRHIALPRGCLDDVRELLRGHGIRCDIRDERHAGEPLVARFSGTLRPDQQAALDALLAHDAGVLCAPTAFGKTVVAAALIAARQVNTLILVHRTDLMRQWKERLRAFLDIEAAAIGTVGGGTDRRTGLLDVAVMQSLARRGDVDADVERYGQVIVDECHHLSAVSFEAILKRVRARYVVGLTATPGRRDGQQPVIFMQCGPVRHTARRPDMAIQSLDVVPHFVQSAAPMSPNASIQDVFKALATDAARTARIVAEIVRANQDGRKSLVLTERTEHLDAIEAALSGRVPKLFVLHGRSSRKQRTAVQAALAELQPDAPHVLLATGRLVGEGFDHPPLDTLVLAMPISWKGSLQQYAGRLHREHVGKTAVRILDFVDTHHPALMRMWGKRQAGYRAMGYHALNADDLFAPASQQSR